VDRLPLDPEAELLYERMTGQEIPVSRCDGEFPECESDRSSFWTRVMAMPPAKPREGSAFADDVRQSAEDAGISALRTGSIPVPSLGRKQRARRKSRFGIDREIDARKRRIL